MKRFHQMFYRKFYSKKSKAIINYIKCIIVLYNYNLFISNFYFKSWLWAILIFSTVVISSKLFNSGNPYLGLLLFFTVIVVALFKLIKFLGNK